MNQPAHHTVADLGVIRQLADRSLAAFERRQRFLALGRQPIRDCAGRAIFG